MKKPVTYAVRIDYKNGMERIDLTANDRLDLLVHLARILRIKEQNTGVHHTIVSVTIESE